MKKYIWWLLLWLGYICIISTPTYADDIEDLFNSIMTQGYFNCALNEIADTYVTIGCPVQTSSWSTITTYKTVISTGSQSTVDFSTISGRLYTGVTASNGMIKLTINNLSSTQKYVVTIVAMNASWTMINNWFSNELSFVIADEMKKSLTTPSTTTSPTTVPSTPSANANTQMHNAGGTNMSQALGNISPIQNGNRVRVTFTPNWSSSTVEFLIRHSSEANFRSVASVPLSQWFVEFDVTRWWTYTLRALPKNNAWTVDGTELRQQIILQPIPGEPAITTGTTTTTTTTRINITDKTWPTENIMIVFALAIWWYLRFRSRRYIS